MKNYTTENPDFTNVISIPETTDPAHADIISEASKQVFRNTMYLKEKMEEMNEENRTLGQRVAEVRFKELYGLVNKTVTLSADRSIITSVSGDIKVTTTISKSNGNTTLKTIVEKGEEEQEGYEKYTKTTVMSTLTDGRKQISVSYTKNEEGE